MPVLDAVLADPGRRARTGWRPRAALGTIATPAAEALLLRRARDRDPRVQQAVFAALGWFGGPDARTRSSARSQPRRRPRPAPAGVRPCAGRAPPRARRPLPSAEAPARPIATDPRGRRQRHRFAQRQDGRLRPRAISPEVRRDGCTASTAASRGYSLRCGRREWTDLHQQGAGPVVQRADAPDRSRPGSRPSHAGGTRSERLPSPQYVVLTRPDRGRGAPRRRAERRRDPLHRHGNA